MEPNNLFERKESEIFFLPQYSQNTFVGFEQQNDQLP